MTTADTSDQFGNAGELHQGVHDGNVMTTAQGAPMYDDQNQLRAGDHGPILLEDAAFREKIMHFDHERIPERVVHARGYGAHGEFESYADHSDLTAAHLFGAKGRKTPLFVRFSTVAGNMGSADLARDVRGWATKFYTEEGNWDLVGNNIPVFFIQDAIKFPDLIHSVKEEQDRGWPQAASAHDTFWDFISLMPEATHMALWAMSDRAIPRSFRFMEGFGVHTFRFVTAEGKSSYVKFHWKPLQGLQSVVWNEAVKINGADADFHRKDLWEAINSGDYPRWELGVQVFDDAFADSFDFDILDPTKIVPEELVPVRPLGKMTLNKTVDNVFSETEQVAFMTQNVVPGIDFTNDPLLQGRNFSYLDTQLSRLGSTNHTQLPINAPRCPVAHFQRDGHMQFTHQSGRANYEPNSFTGTDRGPRANTELKPKTFPEHLVADVRRIRPESFADHYSQANQFWKSQTEIEQQHIVEAFGFELGKCEIPAIRERVVANLVNVSDKLAQRVADELGIDVPEAAPAKVTPRHDLPVSDALSIVKNGPKSFAGRKLGVIVSNGSDAALINAVKSACEKAGVTVEFVAKQVAGVKLSDGSRLVADHAVVAAPSVLFDAVALLPSADGAKELGKVPEARDFINDAFAHDKFIAFGPDAEGLFDAAGVASKKDDGFLEVSSDVSVEAFIEACAALRYWKRES